MTAQVSDEGHCDVDLWIVPLAQAPSEVLLRACLDVLNADERRSAERYKIRSRRAQAIVSRAVLRRALSHRLGRGPETWRFETSPRGRPSLAPGQGADGVDFNVSHTEGCVVCAIAQNARVGVDVEARNRLPDIAEVASRFLSPSEAQAVSEMSRRAAGTALLRLWTLKEALAKGIGIGMALDFPAINLPVEQIGDGSEFSSRSAKRWAFRAYRNGPMHAIGLAYRALRPCDVTLRFQSDHRAIGVAFS